MDDISLPLSQTLSNLNLHLELEENNINVGLDQNSLVVEISDISSAFTGHSRKPLLFGMQENFDFDLTFRKGGISIKLVFDFTRDYENDGHYTPRL